MFVYSHIKCIGTDSICMSHSNFLAIFLNTSLFLFLASTALYSPVTRNKEGSQVVRGRE